jgi:hypothetical protein
MSSVLLSQPPLRPPCLDKMSLEPPTYTPSADVPAYSVIPRPTERILAATARLRRRTPTGVFVRSNSLITVALREQEEDALMPSYGRHGTICGDIALSCSQGVQAVYIKVSTGFFSLLRSFFDIFALFFLFSWRVDYTWLARKAHRQTRRFSACRMMCGGGPKKTVVRRVLACSRSRPCYQRVSGITDSDARSRPRMITHAPRHGTSEHNAIISSGSSSSARGASWPSGSSPKSECVDVPTSDFRAASETPRR